MRLEQLLPRVECHGAGEFEDGSGTPQDRPYHGRMGAAAPGVRTGWRGRTAAFILSGLAVLSACGSPDHTGTAKNVLSDSDFGQPYEITRVSEDPAVPGSVGFDLRFARPPDLDAIHPPAGFDSKCGITCDVRYYDGPENGSDNGRCEMFVNTLAYDADDVLMVLVSCGPAYGDP